MDSIPKRWCTVGIVLADHKDRVAGEEYRTAYFNQYHFACYSCGLLNDIHDSSLAVFEVCSWLPETGTHVRINHG